MKTNVIVVYYRQPHDEIIKDDKLFFKENTKPNGVIQMLKGFFTHADCSGIWIATSQHLDKSYVPLREKITLELNRDFTLRRVPISNNEVEGFYYKTCKEGLWPILHNFPEKFNCNAINWEVFETLNRRFAEAACEEANDESIIWIHDYNLMLAPYYIRQQKPKSKIAYFFHTNFPGPDIFNMLPWRQQIVESLLCCDFISFDIPRYVENFVATVSSNVSLKQVKKEKVKRSLVKQGLALNEPYVTKQVVYKDFVTRIDAFPEGTDYELIKKILAKPYISKRISDIKKKSSPTLIFTASRADYIKGSLELLQCYERLLYRRSGLIGNITLCLVSVHPGCIEAYTSLHKEIERMVDQINKQFSLDGWNPINYIKHPLTFEEMIPWFSAADIMWVPSLRDGMNIISKEFVAVKEGQAGVLILSEFAGSSIELHEAVLTNPYSSSSMDWAIDVALSMPIPEQKQRMQKMFKKMLLSDINVWSQQLNILKNLQLKNTSTLPSSISEEFNSEVSL